MKLRYQCIRDHINIDTCVIIIRCFNGHQYFVYARRRVSLLTCSVQEIWTSFMGSHNFSGSDMSFRPSISINSEGYKAKRSMLQRTMVKRPKIKPALLVRKLFISKKIFKRIMALF